jgi:two-component system phosphate regulon sensor histidine kinase PhoR
MTLVLIGLLAAALAAALWRASGLGRRAAQLEVDIERLKDRRAAAKLELSREKAQVSAILANMVEAVIAVDGSGRVVAVNPALARLFGIGGDAAPGRPLIEVLRHHRLNELLGVTAADGQARVEEVRVAEPDERVFEAHTGPLRLDDGPPGALLVLHEITRIRKLEQVRKDFVANVSHEMRTPLASIRAFAETLRLGGLDDRENRLSFVEAIESDAERMTRLVDDLLELAALESGGRLPKLEKLKLEAAAREVVTGLQPLAARKKVKLEVGPFDAAPVVLADRVQLRHVLTNLLDNAIKFNKEGGLVSLSSSLGEGQVVVSVRDTGPGIPASDQPRLFERFYRVDSARSRELGGTGLGLSIVKHIVEAHGGAVSVESRVGEGSTFRFTLPVP